MRPEAITPKFAGKDLHPTLYLSLGVVAVHSLLAYLFFQGIVGDELTQTQQGSRTAVFITVGTVGLLQLLALGVIGQGSPNPARTAQASRWLPTLTRWTPLLLAPIALAVTLGQGVLAGGGMQVAGLALPVVSATWSSGILLGAMQKRLLRSWLIRERIRANGPLLQVPDPANLPDAFGYILMNAVAAASVIATAIIVLQLSQQNHADDQLSTFFALGTIVALFAVSMFSGFSVGYGPGRDILSMARRLDSTGYSQRPAQIPSNISTSDDEIGSLQTDLEHLHTRLAQELEIYEKALSRTRHTEAIKAEFLAAVSHELRTPLNSICGFAQLLLDDVAGQLTEPQKEDVRLVLAGGEQLLALINDILDMSMIESGELSLTFAEVDLADVINEVVSIHRSLVRESHVDLRVRMGPLPLTVCDRRRLTQVLTNLLSNAIKFTEQGSIEVSSSYNRTMDCVQISVSDTGVGIEEDKLQAIFEEYEQVGSLKRKSKGTGLGLAIARTIAVHHGGSLSVESTFGTGSTFTLMLPRKPQHLPSSIDMTREAAERRLTSMPTSPEAG